MAIILGYVLFKFRNIMRDIIDNVHVKIIRGGVERLCKSLPRKLCQLYIYVIYVYIILYII